MDITYTPPGRLLRLDMPERIRTEGRPLRALERELEQAIPTRPVVDLTYANTHRFPPHPSALAAFTTAARGAGMTYTPYRGDTGVRREVAGHVSGLLGVDVDGTSDVILTPGTQAGLYTALSAILEPGDRVVIPDPDYITSERSVRYLDASYISVPLIWEPGSAPHLDLDALREALAREPKLLMFSHPNNPTGAVFEPDHLREIADLVRDTATLVLVDELYSRLVYDGAPFAHFIAEPGMRERTITTLGPSKTESLSGFRIGMAVAPPEIVDRMEDVMSIASLRCPAYAQHVLSRWIVDDAELVASRLVEYQALRDRSVEVLGQMPGVDVRPSGGTAYLFPDVSALDITDQELALALKVSAGLVVNPGYQFGSRGRHHFRICFAQDEAEWDDALQRMAEVISGFPVPAAG